MQISASGEDFVWKGIHCMYRPPFAIRCVPLIQLARGSQRNATANAISCVLPNLAPTGVLSMTGCTFVMNSSPACAKPSVIVGPGLTALTVTPYVGGNSFAHTLVKLSTMPLLPAYIVCIGGASRAEVDTILTMRPPCFGRCGNEACVSRNVPRPLRLTSKSQSSRVCSSNGLLIASAALLTRMSILPNSLTAALTSFIGPLTVEISASTAMALVGKLAASLSASSRSVEEG